MYLLHKTRETKKKTLASFIHSITLCRLIYHGMDHCRWMKWSQARTIGRNCSKLYVFLSIFGMECCVCWYAPVTGNASSLHLNTFWILMNRPFVRYQVMVTTTKPNSLSFSYFSISFIQRRSQYVWSKFSHCFHRIGISHFSFSSTENRLLTAQTECSSLYSIHVRKCKKKKKWKRKRSQRRRISIKFLCLKIEVKRHIEW